MSTSTTTQTRPSPITAIRAFCRECDPEPRAAHLLCDISDCPLFRFRDGRDPDGRRKGRPANLRSFARGTSGTFPAGIASDSQTGILRPAHPAIDKSEGKPHLLSWPFGELGFRDHERPLKAIRRMCIDCCGTRDVAGTCCSPNCALAPYRFGRRPRPGDVAPVPNVPGYLKGTSRE